MKTKEYDRVRLLQDMEGDFGEHIPAGTEGAIIECFTSPEGYIIDVWIPDANENSGFRYGCVTVVPEQFEVVSEYQSPASD